MKNYAPQGSHSRPEERSSTFTNKPRRSWGNAAVPTRYDGTLFRSRLEARWAAFFNAERIAWKYEPDTSRAGWWPDFRLPDVDVIGEQTGVDCEVKPIEFSPFQIDPAFDKAISGEWTLLLGMKPCDPFVGTLVRNTPGGLQTVCLAAFGDGLECAPIDAPYFPHAEQQFAKTHDVVTKPGVSKAINDALEGIMGRKQFHFDKRKGDAA